MLAFARRSPRRSAPTAPRARRSCRPPRPCTETRAPAPRSPPAARRGGGRDQRHEREAVRVAGAANCGRLLQGRSGTISPHAPVCASRATNASAPGREHHVCVAHEHDRHAPRQPARNLQHPGNARPAASASFPRRGSPGRPRAGPSRAPPAPAGPRPRSRRLRRCAASPQRRIAAHQIWHQRGALAGVGKRVGDALDAGLGGRGCRARTAVVRRRGVCRVAQAAPAPPPDPCPRARTGRPGPARPRPGRAPRPARGRSRARG